MSEAELRLHIERMLQDTAKHMISTDTALEATRQVGQLAAQHRIEWAVAGGVAMYLYGSPRLTNNLDIIASDTLPLQSQRELGFGGERYAVQAGKYAVQVNWIVRNDGYQKYYRAALRQVVKLPDGVCVVTPAWLVILKYFAGRQKDLDDIVFLLRQRDITSRTTIKQKVIDTTGEDAWFGMLPGLRRLFDLADGNTQERSKLNHRD